MIRKISADSLVKLCLAKKGSHKTDSTADVWEP